MCPDIASTLSESYPRLSRLEKRVADYFLAQYEHLTRIPILEVAQACQTSKPSVVRLCKKLGFPGYKDFQKALSAELAMRRYRSGAVLEDIYPGSSSRDICEIVTRTSVEALERTLEALEIPQMEQAVEALAAARRIDLYGVCVNGLLALDAEIKFRRIGYQAHAPWDSHRQAIAAATLGKGDVAVVFCYYGETVEVLELCETIRARGATLIAVTRRGGNSLAARADIVLCSDSAETMPRVGTMSARLSMLLVTDMLFTLLISRRYEDFKPVLEATSQATFRKMHTAREG